MRTIVIQDKNPNPITIPVKVISKRVNGPDGGYKNVKISLPAVKGWSE